MAASSALNYGGGDGGYSVDSICSGKEIVPTWEDPKDREESYPRRRSGK